MSYTVYQAVCDNCPSYGEQWKGRTYVDRLSAAQQLAHHCYYQHYGLTVGCIVERQNDEDAP